ncbi:MAG: hypothetical protein AAF609_08640 [Cyanobacteria bacterium P01_C01_bin.120]
MGIYRKQNIFCKSTFEQGESFPFRWSNAFPDWLQSPPPERTGLNGEYDYYGLQKRVETAFKRNFSADELARLVISQRGRVVILQGVVRDRLMLHQLIDLAEQMEGTYRVEANWVNYDIEEAALLAM